MQALQTVEVEAASEAEGSVIWLHGLGADGHDFEAIVPELQLAGVLDLRFIFPHAPVRPVTINNGMSMRAWYDIFSLDRGGPQDPASPGFDSCATRICDHSSTNLPAMKTGRCRCTPLSALPRSKSRSTSTHGS